MRAWSKVRPDNPVVDRHAGARLLLGYRASPGSTARSTGRPDGRLCRRLLGVVRRAVDASSRSSCSCARPATVPPRRRSIWTDHEPSLPDPRTLTAAPPPRAGRLHRRSRLPASGRTRQTGYLAPSDKSVAHGAAGCRGGDGAALRWWARSARRSSTRWSTGRSRTIPAWRRATPRSPQPREQLAAVRGTRLPQVDVNARVEHEQVNLGFGFDGFPGQQSRVRPLFGGRRRLLRPRPVRRPAPADRTGGRPGGGATCARPRRRT